MEEIHAPVTRREYDRGNAEKQPDSRNTAWKRCALSLPGQGAPCYRSAQRVTAKRPGKMCKAVRNVCRPMALTGWNLRLRFVYPVFPFRIATNTRLRNVCNRLPAQRGSSRFALNKNKMDSEIQFFMDKTILNLLFRYEGRISYREFRAGTTLLFLLVGTHLGLVLNSALTTAIAGRMGGADWLAANTMYNQIMRNFTPDLVPVWFIVSYSSFVLAAKRIRELNGNRTTAMVSGIVNYLFFASFITLLTLSAYQTELREHTMYMSFITPALIYAVITCFVAGVANLLFLCIRREAEPSYPLPEKGYLDAIGYSIKLGNLMGIAAMVSMAISLVLSYLDLFGLLLLYSSVSQVIAGLCSLVFLFFYIQYSLYRLKDAHVSVVWLIAVMSVYFVLFGFQIWLNLHIQNNLTAYYNTLFGIVTSFFIAAQYALFVLPSKKDERKLNEEE